MEGVLAWVASGVSLIAGIGGLILGIRAEARNRYRKLWVPEFVTRGIRFHNRTGEDAVTVAMVAARGWRVPNQVPYSMVPPDGVAQFALVPDDPRQPAEFGAAIMWVRASNGKQYIRRFGEKNARRNLWRIRWWRRGPVAWVTMRIRRWVTRRSNRASNPPVRATGR